MKSPIEIVNIILLELLIAGTWILYRKPGIRKKKITINSVKPIVTAQEKNAFTIHKP